MAYSLSKNLDKVFNTQSVLIIQSAFRDLVSFPNANSYQIRVPVLLNSIADVKLTHFLSNQLAAPSQAIYISMDQFDNNRVYAPGYTTQNISFIVPTGIDPVKIDYVSQQAENDLCVFPKDYKPNVSTIFITIYNDAGILVPLMPEHTIRLFINHYC